MRNTLLKGLVAAAVGSLMMVGNVMALPTLPVGLEFNSSDYWTVTDMGSGLATFELMFNNPGAELDSSFGLYAKSDSTKKIEVFSYNQIPNTDEGPWASIYLQYNNGWEASNDNVTWIDFDNQFGFYGDVYRGSTLQNTFYSDIQYNQDGVEHFAVGFKYPNIATIYFEDLYGRDIMWTGDIEDLRIGTTDIQPVPEPATVLLFGTGIVGLAGLSRRRKNKK